MNAEDADVLEALKTGALRKVGKSGNTFQVLRHEDVPESVWSRAPGGGIDSDGLLRIQIRRLK